MSNYRGWKIAFVAALGAISMTSVATAAGAAAETNNIAVTEAAPACFSLHQWDDWTWTGYRSHAEVKNNCNRAYRVRLIWNDDFDGSCKSVLPGTGFSEWRQGKMPSVDEIRVC